MRVLSLPAAEVQPFDGLTENTVVQRVTHHEVERYDPLTGQVTRQKVVTITSSLARMVVVDEFEGQHLHDIEHGAVDEHTFAPDEVVRVARPALIAKCSCGFPPDEPIQNQHSTEVTPAP